MSRIIKYLFSFVLSIFLLFSSSAQISVSNYYKSSMGGATALVQYNNKCYILSNGLWEYDGIVAPKLITNIMYGRELILFNNKLYAKGGLGTDGELWCYDFNTVYQAADINTGTEGSGPQDFFIFKNKLFLNAYNGTAYKRYKYDGLSAPVMVSNSSAVLGNDLHILADKFTFVYDGYLYACDGNSDPVRLFAGAGMLLGSSIVFNSNLYFKAGNVVGGYEIFKYSGIGNDVAIKIPLSGMLSNNDPVFKVAFGKLFFSGNAPSKGIELCALDVNDQFSFVDINTGTASSTPTYMSYTDNTLYISATTTATGNELWKYDGVSAPTLVSDLNTGTGSSSPGGLFIYRDTIFFRAAGTAGSALYSYDKTHAPVKRFDLSYKGIFNGILLLSGPLGLYEYDGLPLASISYSTIKHQYGEPPFNIKITTNSSGNYFFTKTSGTSLKITDSIAGSASIASAGTSSIYVFQQRSSIYTKSFYSFDVIIDKAPLVITALDQTIEQNTKPQCLYTVTGFVYDEKESDFSDPIICDFHMVGNAIGTYQYYLYNRLSSNYEVTSNKANVIVTAPIATGTIGITNKNLNLYPNPSNGLLQGPENFTDIHIRLISIDGKTEEYTSLPVHTTMKGLTLVEMNVDGKIYRSKILFQ